LGPGLDFGAGLVEQEKREIGIFKAPTRGKPRRLFSESGLIKHIWDLGRRKRDLKGIGGIFIEKKEERNRKIGF
jgi:hypothetical protein